MEIQFRQQNHYYTNEKGNTKLSKGKSKKRNNNKLVGVRQRPSGRWVAEIKDTTQKIRMWLGTFETAEEAARAYDEAACLLRGSNTRTNFITHVSPDSPLALRIRNLLTNQKPQSQANKAKGRQQQQRQGKTTTSATSDSSGNNVGDGCVSDRMFDDAYKPDMSECDLVSLQPDDDLSWSFPLEGLSMIDNGNENENESEFFEFERMRVERQISASLYAMNGVHEYMEAVHDPDEALWDLPPLSSGFC